MGVMTVSVTLLQTFNTFSDDVSDLLLSFFWVLDTWFKVDNNIHPELPHLAVWYK